ncbi:hypothetical protein ACI1MP_37470 (plasmid) [Kitasatospora griseola]|uniref:hypothetical protein n=1 Tax=Kitasatospora griseola TaxID=2064 RepID=UPI00385585D1
MDAKATVIEQRSWRDPEGTIIAELETALKTLSVWEMRHEILGQSIDGVTKDDGANNWS